MHRGHGIAAALLRRLLGFLRRRGVTSISLTVRVDNTPGIALYGKLGFQRYRRIKFYYEDGAPAWRMRMSCDGELEPREGWICSAVTPVLTRLSRSPSLKEEQFAWLQPAASPCNASHAFLARNDRFWPASCGRLPAGFRAGALCASLQNGVVDQTEMTARRLCALQYNEKCPSQIANFVRLTSQKQVRFLVCCIGADGKRPNFVCTP
jgi:hypothetical protein